MDIFMNELFALSLHHHAHVLIGAVVSAIVTKTIPVLTAAQW